MSSSLQAAEELLWRQYNSYLGLYKFYSSSAIKLNTFHFAITGAVLSFYLAHTSDKALRLALVLPLVFSISLVAIFGWGSLRANDLTSIIAKLSEELSRITNPQVANANGFRPATEALWGLLLIFMVLNLLTALALAALILEIVPLQ
jgi:hypothetical protein